MKIWKKDILLIFVLCLNLTFSLEAAADTAEAKNTADANHTAEGTAEEREEELELYARSAVLMDGDSGRILYGKNSDQEMPMASTTKIMTCIVALENASPDKVCTASQNAAAQPRVKLGMKKGEQFYLKDLLYSLMLESHNDSAVCIAEAVAGSVEGFADLMNQKAKEIGCESTYYITPNGLDAEDDEGVHRTTAEELAMVMRYCLTMSSKADEFLEITRAGSHTFSSLDQNSNYGCSNHNALLTILDGALSGKTGFTNDAGYCYVGAVEKEDKLLIVALLACGWPGNKGYKWADTKKLVRYGQENYEKRRIINRNLETAGIPVENGVKEMVGTEICWTEKGYRSSDEKNGILTGEVQENGDTDIILMKKEEKAEVRIRLKKRLTAPVTEKTEVGTVSFLVDETEYASFPVITSETVAGKNYVFWLRKLYSQFVNFMTKKLAFFS